MCKLNGIIFDHTISGQPEINLEYLLYKNPRYLLLILAGLPLDHYRRPWSLPL